MAHRVNSQTLFKIPSIHIYYHRYHVYMYIIIIYIYIKIFYAMCKIAYIKYIITSEFHTVLF